MKAKFEGNSHNVSSDKISGDNNELAQRLENEVREKEC